MAGFKTGFRLTNKPILSAPMGRMKRRMFLLAGLFIAAVAFTQAMPTMAATSRREPPCPGTGREGHGDRSHPDLSFHPSLPSDTAGVRKYIATPETLENELAYLKENGYTSVTFADLRTRRATPAAQARHHLVRRRLAEPVRPTRLPLLKKYGFTATFYVWVVVVGMKHHMTWDEVRAGRDAGMEIGCHTITHPYPHAHEERRDAAEGDPRREADHRTSTSASP